MEQDEEYLTECETSKLARRAQSTLRKDRYYGRGIPFIRWGRRFVRYRKSDVLEFLEGKRVETSDSRGRDDGLGQD